MARKLGYGGLANTDGARSFSGKGSAGPAPARQMGYGGLGNTLGTRDFSGKVPQFPSVLILYGQRSNVRSLLGR